MASLYSRKADQGAPKTPRHRQASYRQPFFRKTTRSRASSIFPRWRDEPGDPRNFGAQEWERGRRIGQWQRPDPPFPVWWPGTGGQAGGQWKDAGLARRFRGSEEVKVDAKGRVSIPAKFRRVFESCDPDWETGKRPQLVIVYGRADWRHLELYTLEAIEEIDAQIDQMQRGSPERRLLESIMHGAAEEAEIDPDGRLVLPQKLREKVGLDDRAFFVAAGDYLKVWRPETYDEAEGDAVEALVAELGEGFDPRSLLPPLASARRAESRADD